MHNKKATSKLWLLRDLTHNCKTSVGKDEENGWRGRAEGRTKEGGLVNEMEGGKAELQCFTYP